MKRKTIKKYLFWIRLKRVFDLLPSQLKGKIGVIFFLIIVNTILDLFGIALFIPLLMLFLTDNYLEKYPLLESLYQKTEFLSETQFTIALLVCIFFLIIAKNLLSIFVAKKQTKLVFDIQTTITSISLRSFLEDSLLNLKKVNSNKIVWEVTVLPMYFTKFVIMPLITFINELLISSIIAITLFSINPKLVLILIIVPIAYVFYRITNNKIQLYQKRLAEIAPKLNSLAQQAVFGYIDILLTQTKDNFLKEYDKYQREYKEINTKVFTYIFIPAKIIETSAILVIILLIVGGLLFGEDKEQVLSFLGLFAIATYRLIPSFNRITVSMMSFKSYQYTVNRLNKVLERLQTKQLEKEKYATELNFNHSIQIKNLSFAYKTGKDVLKNVNLTINKGENIGIIGESGSGKSTLMNIILGVINTYKGDILVDGQKLTLGNLNAWFAKIGYVQQNIFLLDGTIRENIAFGQFSDQIDENKIQQSVRGANLDEFISSLPHGLETKVGELGSLISGGQKQRIGIARAIYSDAEILLLDEATSALDGKTEQQIIETLKNLSETNNKLTTITIAHRLSTLKHCQHIYDIANDCKSSTFDELNK